MTLPFRGIGGMSWRDVSARVRSFTFDLAISCGVLALGAVNVGRPYVPYLAAGMGLVLLARRRRPVIVMAVISALALVQVLLTHRPYVDPMPFDVAILIGMYSVVKYAGRLRDGFLAGGVLLIGVIIEVARHDTSKWWVQVLFYAALGVGVWLGGYIARIRRDYLMSLEQRAETLEREREHLAQIAVAHERATIAREMHDVVAHSLAVIIVQADGGRYAMAQDPEKGRATLETVAGTAREALDEMRRLIELLRYGADEEPPLADRQVSGIGRLDALVARARDAGVDAHLRVADLGVPDSSATSLAVYRLVQEGLTNVLRHSGPGALCQVEVAREMGRIRVSVVDDGGAGPKLGTEEDRVGHGLVGMRERVAVLGGSLRVGPRGNGWEVVALLPEHVATPLPVEPAIDGVIA